MNMQEDLMKKILKEIDPDGSKLKAALKKNNYPVANKFSLSSSMLLVARLQLASLFKNKYRFECIKPDGTLRWAVNAHNIMVNTGLSDFLDKYWLGSTYTAQHYMGLISDTPTIAPTDTMVSHPGWTEVHTEYSEGTRSDLTAKWNPESGQSIDNSGTPCSYNIISNVTIGGGMITTDATKGATTGVLIGAVAFDTGDRPAQIGDTLNVTASSTAANAP